uniref:Claudin 5a n=1 Tax=Labrus bergylta TaxID=56723 RepID=A0A3Q3GJZ9_9LABR
MVSAGLEILGLALCVIGSLLVMVSCGLPMWKVTAFIEANIVVAQYIWDGLWMSCVVQSTGLHTITLKQLVCPQLLHLSTHDVWKKCCNKGVKDTGILNL